MHKQHTAIRLTQLEVLHFHKYGAAIDAEALSWGTAETINFLSNFTLTPLHLENHQTDGQE